jgi:hypothetical protein
MHSRKCLQARGQLEEARALCHVPVEYKGPSGCGSMSLDLRHLLTMVAVEWGGEREQRCKRD